MNKEPDNVILVTGFEPFGEFTSNPSGDIASKLDGEIIGNCRVKGIVLPCIFGKSADELEKIIITEQPTVVICMGQAADRKEINIENCAMNLACGEIPDNAGVQPIDEPIIENGESYLYSTLKIGAIMTALKTIDIPASLSNSAGLYVCNYVFYRLMAFLEQYPEIRGGFVHIPLTPEQVTDNHAAMPFEMMTEAIKCLIEVESTKTDSGQEGNIFLSRITIENRK